MVGYVRAHNHAALPGWPACGAVPARPTGWRVQARRWPSGLDPPTQGGEKCERWSCQHLQQSGQQRLGCLRFHTHACSGRSRALQPFSLLPPDRLLWPMQASDGGVRDHGFLGTSVMCVDPAYSTEIRMGGTPHCIFRRERRNYIHNPVRNGSLCPMSSAGSLLLASPAGKPNSRNACSSVPGRLGGNPARRQAYAPPAPRLCSWVMSQWGQWLGSATAEVTLVSAQSTNAVMTIDWT